MPDNTVRAINHHKSNPSPRCDLEVTPELHTFSQRTHAETHSGGGAQTQRKAVWEPRCHFHGLSHTAAATGLHYYSHSHEARHELTHRVIHAYFHLFILNRA